MNIRDRLKIGKDEEPVIVEAVLKTYKDMCDNDRKLRSSVADAVKKAMDVELYDFDTINFNLNCEFSIEAIALAVNAARVVNKASDDGLEQKIIDTVNKNIANNGIIKRLLKRGLYGRECED